VDAGPGGGGMRMPGLSLPGLHCIALRGATALCWLALQAGVSAPRPTHFLCWCKESKPRKHLEYNAACGGGRRHRSLRSSRWRARSRAAGARQGHLHQRSGAWANPLGHPRQALFEALRYMPHRCARYRETGRAYSERSDARWATGSRVPAFRCPNGLAGVPLRSHSRPCRAPAARDRAHHRPERSDRRLRQPPHAAFVFQVLSWLTFFAPAKKVSRPRGRNPRLQCKPTQGRRPAKRTQRQAGDNGPAPC
jgi:hypothetical protein